MTTASRGPSGSRRSRRRRGQSEAQAPLVSLVGGVSSPNSATANDQPLPRPSIAAMRRGRRTEEIVRPASPHKPRSGLDLRGALLATANYKQSSLQITRRSGNLAGLPSRLCSSASAASGLPAIFTRGASGSTDTPLLRIERLADRAVGGGLFLMLAAAGSIFGLFLLSSLYLQNVLEMGPLATGLAFIPLAVSAGIGAHAAGHIVSHRGVRGPLAAAFAVTAGGMARSRHVGSGTAACWRNVTPGCSSPEPASESPSSPCPSSISCARRSREGRQSRDLQPVTKSAARSGSQSSRRSPLAPARAGNRAPERRLRGSAIRRSQGCSPGQQLTAALAALSEVTSRFLRSCGGWSHGAADPLTGAETDDGGERSQCQRG